MTIKRVGLIGVGLMGHGIGKNILAKGFQLTVMAHQKRALVDDLVSLGAHERNNPMSIAKECDMVIICVTGSPQVEHIVHGEYGLINAVRPGLVIADCSTSEPESTKRLASDVEAKGGHFVDTPMTRTPKEAEAGKLGLMTGGPAEVRLLRRHHRACRPRGFGAPAEAHQQFPVDLQCRGGGGGDHGRCQGGCGHAGAEGHRDVGRCSLGDVRPPHQRAAQR